MTRISVVIPALNEEATVADVVKRMSAENPHEVIVVDNDSTDGTAAAARRAGARVVAWNEVAPEIPTRPGKGEALWRGVKCASGEVVVFIDADLEKVPDNVVARLAEPFSNPGVHLVKAAYDRAYRGNATGGGRVTALTARPLLNLYFPQLGHITQPLSGEYAVRRDTALALPFVAGYGVEAGLLIDVTHRHGPNSAHEVFLGTRVHRNRPLDELGPMADVVARTILSRAGVLPAGVPPVPQRPAWNTLG